MPPFRSLIASCLALGALFALGCSDSDEDSSTSALQPDDSAVCQSALFCDDFESLTAGVAPSGAWATNPNNGSVTVDTTRAFRGAQSVKASTLSTAETGSTYKQAFMGVTGAPVVPVPSQAVYGRMMFYLESAPATSVHWTFADATGTVPGQTYHATYRYGGQLPIQGGSQLMANYDTTDFYQTPPVGPNTDCYQHADGKVVPVGQWSCAELFFDGANASMHFWLDGAELTDLAVNRTGEGCVADPQDQTWVAPTIERLNVGWESYQTDDARSIWIDDVVFSSTRVGCPGGN
ncbi:MAG TPA: hypothetical protein VNN80_26095 [Polyangiaceae bacterium]|nr:hypothetical protein [Polyangiaceae bacterium]